MSRRFLVPVLTFLAASSVGGCFTDTFKVAESEVLIRYLPESDEFLLLEIEHGIAVGDEKDDPIAKSVAMLQDLHRGKRIYPASGSWFATDFDEHKGHADGLAEEEAKDFADFLDGLQVAEHGLYLEALDKLSYFRLTRLKHGKHQLEIINRFVTRGSRKDPDSGLSSVPNFPFYDEESREAFRKAVADGHSWLSLVDGTVVLDVPMTAASAAQCLGEIACDERGEREKADARAMLGELSGIEVSGGHVRLKFGGASHPLVRFSYHSERARQDGALIGPLLQAKVVLGAPSAPDAALAKVRGVRDQIRSK